MSYHWYFNELSQVNSNMSLSPPTPCTTTYRILFFNLLNLMALYSQTVRFLVYKFVVAQSDEIYFDLYSFNVLYGASIRLFLSFGVYQFTITS